MVTRRFIKSDQHGDAPFPTGDAANCDIVWIAEFDYIEEGVYNAQRYYDRQGNPVSAQGTPLPERPASVPERAYYVDNGSSIVYRAHWQTSEKDERTNTFTGYVVCWELNGDLMQKWKYNTSNQILEEQHQYMEGKLHYSRYSEDGVEFEISYHLYTDPPVLSKKIVYRNHDNDREEIFFDEAGQQLFSERVEKISNFHQRIYYNGILVYECIKQKDLCVNYRYPNGTIMIDYAAGDGTGYWQLYDGHGQVIKSMPVIQEPVRDESKDWQDFIPVWGVWKEQKATTTYWDTITARFNAKYNEQRSDNIIAALEVPEHVQLEFDKANLDKALLPEINGFLSKDEAVAGRCESRLLKEMYVDGMIAYAAFGIGKLVAHLIPYYVQEPGIRQRLSNFLSYRMAQPEIKDYDQEPYAELEASLKSLFPLLLQWAGDADDEYAMHMQYLLIIGGKEKRETETLLQQEWNNTAHTRERRSYAVFALGRWYASNAQTEKMIATFSSAFLKETDSLIRLILAVNLVETTKEAADERWLAELFTTLTNAAEIRDDFLRMEPFCDIVLLERYVLKLLNEVAPVILEKNIASLIAQLPVIISQRQESHLYQAIVSQLLQYGSAIDDMNSLTQTILLALADKMENEPRFAEGQPKWYPRRIPRTADGLRELVNKRKK